MHRLIFSSPSFLRVRAAAVVLAALVLSAAWLTGCGRSPSTVAPPPVKAAAFTPEGRWRSQKGMTFTVKLDPDGTLEMADPRGGRHPFHRVGPDRWEARVTPYVKGSIRREGDQLIYRGESSGKAPEPVRGKNGMMMARQ